MASRSTKIHRTLTEVIGGRLPGPRRVKNERHRLGSADRVGARGCCGVDGWVWPRLDAPAGAPGCQLPQRSVSLLETPAWWATERRGWRTSLRASVPIEIRPSREAGSSALSSVVRASDVPVRGRRRSCRRQPGREPGADRRRGSRQLPMVFQKPHWCSWARSAGSVFPGCSDWTCWPVPNRSQDARRGRSGRPCGRTGPSSAPSCPPSR